MLQSALEQINSYQATASAVTQRGEDKFDGSADSPQSLSFTVEPVISATNCNYNYRPSGVLRADV